MTLHVQAISDGISESVAPVWYYLDEKTLHTLIALLSYSLQAAVRYSDFTPEMSNSADVKLALESDSSEENSGVYIRKGGSISKQVVQLVVDTLQTASDMMLVRENKHVLSYERTCCPHLLLPLILFFSRNTSCSIKPGNTESTPVLSPYTPHTKTKPPQSSAVAQPPSTCLPP